MSSKPTPDWQALSALYDKADTLLLQRMLGGAKALLEGGFLEALPSLLDDSAEGAAGFGAATGEVIGAYRLIRPLGAGGMAEVWLAERCDGAFERQVALKLLFAQAGPARQENFRRRFEREHRILATLRHPHIAALHDAGVTPDGRHWLALEHVAGQPMDTWCDEQRLSVRQRVALFGQVLGAVSHAHARLVIHRDLKPGNILVTAQGEVRLLDFGIAKLLAAEGDTQDETELTRLGGRPLTPRYASPEQLQGQPLDATSDVYTLGVMLYALLCGVSPYRPTGPGVAALERAILNDEPMPPSRQPATATAAALLAARRTNARGLRRQLAPELDAIVLRAMARQSAGRYGSADALAADLTRWLAGEPVQARLPGPWARATKFARRHPWGTGLGAVAVAALSIATAVATVKATQANAEAARARAASDFMLGLFEDADPDRHGGKALTPAQLLVRGRERLASEAAASPVLQGELLAGIAKAQVEMGDHDAAEATFAQWVAHARAQGDAHRVAWALTLRAENDVRREQLAGAKTWLVQADAAQPDATAEAVLRAKRGEVRGWVAQYEGRLDDAMRTFSRALKESRAEGGDLSQQSVDLWVGIAQNAAERGDSLAALAALESAALGAASGDSLRKGKQHAFALGRILVWDKLAEYRRVSEAGPIALEQCERELGVGSAICRSLRGLVLRTLAKQGDLQQAFALWPTLLRIVDGSGSEAERIAALQFVHTAAWQAGDAALQSQASQRLEAMQGGNGSLALRTWAALFLVESALYQEKPDSAMEWVERGRRQASAEGGADEYMNARLLMAEGLCRFSQGQAEAALKLLEQAQRVFEQVLGKDHPLAALLGLNRLGPLEVLRRSPEAVALADVALPVLRRSLGVDAPVVARIEAIRRDLVATRPNQGSARRRFEPFG